MYMHSKCFNVRSKCACVCRHHLFCFRFFSDVSLINRSIWYVWYGTADGHEDPVPPGMVKTLSWDTISTGAGFLLSATRGWWKLHLSWKLCWIRPCRKARVVRFAWRILALVLCPCSWRLCILAHQGGYIRWMHATLPWLEGPQLLMDMVTCRLKHMEFCRTWFRKSPVVGAMFWVVLPYVKGM